MTDKKIKILCVEDEADIRSNISDILRDEGYEVIEAGNGYEGYEVFVRERPDLIISDIMMPKLDGYGLLKMVRETAGLKQSVVPFLFLTALGQKDNVIKGVNLSANDYLIKPIDFDLLVAKVKEKTLNYQHVEDIHQSQIDNLKNQISIVLPKDVFIYLDNITFIASKIKDEPFGPFPHRAYLDEIKKIYFNSLNLRTAINNSLDHDSINFKLNAEEEIIDLKVFFAEYVENIDPTLSQRIILADTDILSQLPNIKIDRITLTEAIGLTIYEMLKIDNKFNIKINAMTDHLKQIVIIFSIQSDDVKININQLINSSKISKVLDKQNCRFEILDNKNNAAIITIPEYRLV